MSRGAGRSFGLNSPQLGFCWTEIPVGGPKRSGPPCCVRGQFSIDPGRWEAAGGQRPIKSIPPGQDRGQRFCFLYAYSCVSGDIRSHTLRALTQYKPLTNGPLAVSYLLVSIQSVVRSPGKKVMMNCCMSQRI